MVIRDDKGNEKPSWLGSSETSSTACGGAYGNVFQRGMWILVAYGTFIREVLVKACGHQECSTVIC